MIEAEVTELTPAEWRARESRIILGFSLGYLIMFCGLLVALFFTHAGSVRSTHASVEAEAAAMQAQKAAQGVIRTQAKIEAARIERVRQLNAVNVAQCKALRVLYTQIRLTLAEAGKSAAAQEYYRTHPGALAEQQRRTRIVVARFAQQPCPPNVKIPNKPINPTH